MFQEKYAFVLLRKKLIKIIIDHVTNLRQETVNICTKKWNEWKQSRVEITCEDKLKKQNKIFNLFCWIILRIQLRARV